MKLESELRHALIHPRPQAKVTDPSLFREAAFFELTTEKVAGLCDDVVEIIQRVSGAVGPDYGEVSLWLWQRNSSGVFPQSTFD